MPNIPPNWKPSDHVVKFFGLAVAVAAVPVLSDNDFLLQVMRDLQSFLIVWMFFRDADKSYIKRLHERLDEVISDLKQIKSRKKDLDDTDFK